MSARRRAAAAIGLAAILGAAAGAAEAPRLANGTPIEGEVKGLSSEGLEVHTPKGVVTYGWPALSTATRYRYQPGYRERFSEALEGQAVPADAEPDARIKALIPSLAQAAPGTTPPGAPAAKPTPKPAAAPKAKADRRTLESQKDDVNTWEFKGTDIPDFKPDHADYAEVVGLRFGPDKEQVVYFAFAPSQVIDHERGKYGKMEKAFAYSPGDPKFGRATLLRAEPQGGSLVGEKPVEVVVKSGQSEHRVKIDWRFSSNSQSSMSITGEVSAVVGGKRVSYLVRTGVNPTRGVAGPLYVKPLFGEPTIVARITDGGTKFKGRVMIGVRKDDEVITETALFPLTAPDTKMKIEVLDAAGRSAASYTVKSTEADFAKEDGWSCEFKKMQFDKEYTARCTMDLGPLGTARLDAPFTQFDLGL